MSWWWGILFGLLVTESAFAAEVTLHLPDQVLVERLSELASGVGCDHSPMMNEQAMCVANWLLRHMYLWDARSLEDLQATIEIRLEGP